MSDTPKFEVIDRRKIKAQEEQENRETAGEQEHPVAPPEPPEPGAGLRLVVHEGGRSSAAHEPKEEPAATEQASQPPAPTAQETHEQKAAYDASAQRIEDLIRAQNPGVGAQPQMSFEHLVQQFYVSALIQMGAGTQEGQQPRVDILGARSTIDLLGILEEKTRGNLTSSEENALQTALYELRMAFLELTGMVSMPNVVPPPPEKQ
jgi:hypothetical protein